MTTEITINGEPRPLGSAQTLAALLGEMGLAEVRLAAELNGRVIPRDQHAETPLSAGDAIELVTFVGGG